MTLDICASAALQQTTYGRQTTTFRCTPQGGPTPAVNRVHAGAAIKQHLDHGQVGTRCGGSQSRSSIFQHLPILFVRMRDQGVINIVDIGRLLEQLLHALKMASLCSFDQCKSRGRLVMNRRFARFAWSPIDRRTPRLDD